MPHGGVGGATCTNYSTTSPSMQRTFAVYEETLGPDSSLGGGGHVSGRPGAGATSAGARSMGLNMVGGSDVASEYARTSEQLLEYVAYLEGEVERAKAEGQAARSRFEQERLGVRSHVALAMERLADARRQVSAHVAAKVDALRAADHLREQLRLSRAMLADEQARAKELETQIDELQEDSKRKDELLEQRRKRERRARRILESQNESLKRKTTLSWMLGCLSDALLDLQPSVSLDAKKTDSLLKMVRKIQRELERENLAVSQSSNVALRTECEQVEDDIRRILNLSSDSSSKPSTINGTNDSKRQDDDDIDAESIDINPQQLELSSARSNAEELQSHDNSRTQARSMNLKSVSPKSSPRAKTASTASKSSSGSRSSPCTSARGRLMAADHNSNESITSRSRSERSLRPAKTMSATISSSHKLGKSSKKKQAAAIRSLDALNLAGLRKDDLPSPFSSDNIGHHGISDPNMKKERLDTKINDNNDTAENCTDSGPASSPWDRFKVLKARQAQRQEILECQNEISNMLRKLKDNMGYLLYLERSSSCASNTNASLMNH